MGKVPFSMMSFGHLKAFHIKTADGQKYKFKAADVVEVRDTIGGMTRMMMIAEQSTTLQGSMTTDWEDLVEREQAIFRQARLSSKKEKYSLLQLMNPGFDSRIQVFLDPQAKESPSYGGFMGQQGQDLSYLIVKDGGTVVKVKKSSYRKKDFPLIFQDCEAMYSQLEGTKVDFKELALHVFAYDQLCGTPAASESEPAAPAAEPGVDEGTDDAESGGDTTPSEETADE